MFQKEKVLFWGRKRGTRKREESDRGVCQELQRESPEKERPELDPVSQLPRAAWGWEYWGW